MKKEYVNIIGIDPSVLKDVNGKCFKMLQVANQTWKQRKARNQTQE